MSSAHHLYSQDLIDARSAATLVLDAAGWPVSSITQLLDELAAPAPTASERSAWERWTDDEETKIDNVLESTCWLLPSAATIRMTAEQLGRSPKSVQSKMERRIKAVERLDARMAAKRAERKVEA